jgi:Flp pilus assembly protein TadD
MGRWRSDEVDALLERVEGSEAGSGIRRSLLEQLAQLTEPGTEAWALATRELARLMIVREPWRASVLARRVVDEDPCDHLAWGVVGLAQSLLGNHAYAVSAYERALTLAPEEPVYLHNLGHLLDAGLDRPADAVPLLRRAHLRLRHDPHVTASLAHALARAGSIDEARRLMLAVVRRPALDEHHALYRWLLDEHERTVRLELEGLVTLPHRRSVRASRATRTPE